MAAQANLVLNTKTYTPRGNIGGIAKWSLAGDASFGGAVSSVTESVRDPGKNSPVSRIKFKLDVPKAADGSSPCNCSGEALGTAVVNIDVVVPSVFTAAERDDLSLRIQGLVASAVFTAAVTDLTGSW